LENANLKAASVITSNHLALKLDTLPSKESHMRIQVPLKTKTILALLIAVAIMDAFSLFLFTRIDTIIHGDLYKYGLQFNYAWADQYWFSSYAFLGSLTIAIILIGISMASFLIHVRKHSTVSRIACYVLLIIGTGLTFLSVYFFYSIDYIVNHDLYLYGLQFSINWAANYWTYARLMLALIGFGSVITITSIMLIFLGTRRFVRVDSARLIFPTLVATGAIALALSIIYASSILAFIGLGLLFWGIIFAYVRTGEYVKQALLDATASSQKATLNEIIQELQCKGNAIYLPPKYLSGLEANKVYIAKLKGTKLPTPEETQEQDPQFSISFIENPEAVLLTPPGAELTKLFEKTLETNFTRVDLQYLQKNMPKLFIEDLELAQNFEMETENNKIRVKIQNSVCPALITVAEQPSNIYSTLGSPLSSAIACALAKSTGKPIIIENHQTNKDGRDVTIEYRILEEEEQAEE
jgi:hypothetical protein